MKMWTVTSKAFIARAAAVGFGLSLFSLSGSSNAQQPAAPAAAPPPAAPYVYPGPPMYAQPAYAQPAYAPPAYAQPASAPPVYVRPGTPPSYHPGDPLPPGYHTEESPRMGLVTAGIVVTAVPYLFGALGAVGADYSNKSGWLLVPWVGPWMNLGQRNYVCDVNDSSASAGLKCVGETFFMIGVITDGVIQAVGGTLLLVGLVSTKTVVVRDEQAIHVTPMRVGSGYGAGLSGAF